MGRKLNLKGQRFGRLIVIKETNKRSGGNVVWECLCDCGKNTFVITSSLTNKRTKSCGCFWKLKFFKANITHGKSSSPEYVIWENVIQRTTNKNHTSYEHYGGRGIKICERWLKFENFYEDMGERPKNKTLDRINNDGGYCPENCRWATRKEQQRNRRNNRLITFRGETKCVSEWSEELKIKPDTLLSRINHYSWSIERALTTKVK